MTCDTCEIKRVGACTAHGGTGWNPHAPHGHCLNAPVATPVIDAEEMQRRALLREPCAAVIGRGRRLAIIEEPVKSDEGGWP
jgi:hypothetical protein